MTKREVLTKAQTFEGWTDEEREVIVKMILALDKKSSKPTKTQVENEGIKAEILEVIATEPHTATEIANALGYTVQKVSALLRQLGDAVEKTPAKGKAPATFVAK